jgi:hypothetical protein
MEEVKVSKKHQHRKDKPWDNDPTLDKWEIKAFNKGGSIFNFRHG